MQRACPKGLRWIELIPSLAAMALGFLLDAVFGDPAALPHPVVWMGRGIHALEKRLRPRATDAKGLRRAGAAMAWIVAGLSLVVPLGILILIYVVNVWLGFVAETFWCFQIFAARSLKKAAMEVYRSLETGTLEDARRSVAMIVGRDTEQLTEEGVIKATVETVAENTSDGVIAPMLYMALGGAPLAMLYKGINTMDSMVGYKNEKFLDFGRAAARTDDAANYVPARLSALLMIAAAGLTGLNAREALRIWRRDRRNHASPNSAQTESACAGALGVQLAGNASYFGKQYEKPTIGDAGRPIARGDIKKAVRLMYGTAILGLVLCLAVRAAVIFAVGGWTWG